MTRLSSTERKTYRIYALTDPTTGERRYVGQTADHLGLRLEDHLRKSRRQSTRKALWLKDLIFSGHQPGIELLEEMVGYRQDAYARESHWITTLRAAGVRLLNHP